MKTRSTVVVPPHGVTITTPHLEREDSFNRTKFVVNVLHCRQPKPAKPLVAELVRDRLKLHPSCPLYLSKFRTAGFNSRGFGLVYDRPEDAVKYEPGYKLKKMGIAANKIHTGGKKSHAAKKIANVNKGKKLAAKKK
ncbi:hypothetical protein KI387_033159, partial [Taxus chinensis]